MLFSPFDALGLKPSNSYTVDEINTAFKKSTVIYHPDKRALHGIKDERWPLILYLTEAKELL